MKIQFTARHFDASSDLQKFAETSVFRLSNLYDGIVNAEIVLEERPHGGSDQVAEVRLNVYRELLVAKEESNDIKTSIQACVAKLERQLQRYKEKRHAGQHPHERPSVADNVAGNIGEEFGFQSI